MTTAYLLLGSNEGYREGLINTAIQQLSQICGDVTEISSLYETAAWGKEDQPTFLNQAIALETGLPPMELLHQLNVIESLLGRQRNVHWGQRTLDIDILFYGKEVIQSQRLTVPHPQLHNRRFALVPLNEIASDFIHPLLHLTVSRLLEICPDALPVSMYKA